VILEGMPRAQRPWVRVVVRRMVLATFVAAASIIVYVVYEGSNRVQTVVAGIGAAVALAVMLWPPPPAPPPPPPPGQMADELAKAVQRQWELAANERNLFHPTPITLRWKRSEVGVAPGRLTFDPLPGMDPVGMSSLSTGDTAQLSHIYGGLDCRRIVLLGEEGAGKSSAAIILLLDALAHRDRLDTDDRARTPVPVLIAIGGWNPRETGLTEWLCDRLTVEYPFLKAPEYGIDAARRLLTKGHVAVLLDGFDEIPVELQADAVGRLNDEALFRLVLLTRPTPWEAATERRPLFGAVALELTELTNREAAEYLNNCLDGRAPEPWRRLVDHLRDNPADSLTEALATPLMVSIVRDNYVERRTVAGGDETANESELDKLLATPFPLHTDAEDYLLQRVIAAAYRPRRGKRRPDYTVAQAERWLAYAAHEMRERGTEDLAWWRIREWRLASVRFLTTALVAGLGSGLVLGFTSGHGAIGALVGGVTGAIVGALLGGLAGRQIRARLVAASREPKQLGRIRWSRILSGNAPVGPVEGRVDGLVFGLLSGVVFGFVLGLTAVRSTFSPLAGSLIGGCAGAALGAVGGSLLKAGNSGTAEAQPRRRARSISRDNIGFGLVFAIVGGFAGLASPIGFIWGSGFGFGVWLTLRVIFRLSVGATLPYTDASSPIDPITSWRRDRLHGLVLGLLYGLVFGLFGGLVMMTRMGSGLWNAGELLLWIVAWLGIGLVAGRAYSNTCSVSLTFLQLHRMGVAPLRMMRFLEDAHRRGVLRTAGRVYQFNHSRLRDQLAEQCLAEDHKTTPSNRHPTWQWVSRRREGQ
jgi:hypothetical protein